MRILHIDIVHGNCLDSLLSGMMQNKASMGSSVRLVGYVDHFCGHKDSRRTPRTVHWKREIFVLTNSTLLHNVPSVSADMVTRRRTDTHTSNRVFTATKVDSP